MKSLVIVILRAWRWPKDLQECISPDRRFVAFLLAQGHKSQATAFMSLVSWERSFAQKRR
jgi:hypothetical protein